MQKLINQAFQDGFEDLRPHIQRGHYNLLGPDDKVIHSADWSHTIRPGWIIKMRMLYWSVDETRPETIQPERRADAKATYSMMPPSVLHNHPSFGPASRVPIIHTLDPINFKQTPLHEAALQGNRKLIKLLLR